MKETTDLREFIENFNIVDNALDMRYLIRWNGRDLRNRENLAEHTHLVVACAMELMDYISSQMGNACEDLFTFENVIKLAMLHDSLEILRGDILSVTKDTIPGLRTRITNEETKFSNTFVKDGSVMDYEIVELADLKACYKYLERELSHPTSDYVHQVYLSTKEKYDKAFEAFKKEYDIEPEKESLMIDIPVRFAKGYLADAGTDIRLDRDVTILPMSTLSVDLNVNVIPKEGEMGVLCARTSAAAKGICVAMCPIDANYTGNVTAIVHNVSNQVITYKKNESFCQVVMIPINKFETKENFMIKKLGKRSDGKMGSTGT